MQIKLKIIRNQSDEYGQYIDVLKTKFVENGCTT